MGGDLDAPLLGQLTIEIVVQLVNRLLAVQITRAKRFILTGLLSPSLR